MFSQPAVQALLLSLAAGLTTVLGCVLIFFAPGKNERLLSVALGLAAGVMLSVSFLDLYPQAENLFRTFFSEKVSVLAAVSGLLSGIFGAAAADKFVPHEAYDPQTGEAAHKNLYRTGMLSVIVIGLHNFPEGIATFMAGYKSLSLGVSLAAAVALHNIPEGIAVAMPIYYATASRSKAVLYTALCGIAEPLGALAAFGVLYPFINDTVLGAVFAFVAGIMIYVTVEELIPSSRQYGHDREALWATFTGICLMPLTHLIHF
ncbi:MAG: zinc transporter ZupT [Alphaproteobacteria bacterium]|nr:zinc transporter ZupT [Alphaproteobacteria bacterium]